MARYFVSKSFSTRNPQTGAVISARAGETITKTKFDKLSSNIIDRCGVISLRNRPRNGEFTKDEFTFLVNSYLSEKSFDEIVTEFYQVFADHVVNDGVLCQLFIIRGLDISNDYVGFNNPAKKLLEVCSEINPSRFN